MRPEPNISIQGDSDLNAQIHATLEPDGILLAVIDMPGKTMNVFSVELMDALDALMDRVERDPAVQSVVLTSGKPSFLAGADLVMVRGYTDSAKTASPKEMFEMCGRLGRQFVRREASPKPWVAAVNGIALGGGTQRLPRLAGFEAATDMLLSGRSIAPLDAVRLGLFACAIPPDRLLDEARVVALSLHGKAYDATAKFPHLTQSDVPEYSASAVRTIAARNGISDQDFADYPAYSAIIDSVLKGARLPMAEATAVEMHQFLRLMFNPVAGNMVGTLFLERLRAERELAAPPNVRIERIENPDGSMRYPEVFFIHCSLDKAMENAAHDEPAFWDRWAEIFRSALPVTLIPQCAPAHLSQPRSASSASASRAASPA